MNNNAVIRLSKSCISNEEKRAVQEVLDLEFLGIGSQVQTFEKQLSEFLGRPVVCVVNGTAALQLALQAAGIQPGDEVLVQSLTYVASFQAISATGAVPVPCEITEDTLTIDIKDMEKKITNKTKAVMPVHYAGDVGPLDGIYSFAEKHGLRVIEDAAHAFGSLYKNRIVGSFGDITCFSFDGIKNITSGEGGCIVSNDAELIDRIKDLRLLSVQKDTDQRYSGKRSWNFDVVEQGWRYHMSNIMAAIGIEQLKRIKEFEHKRKTIAARYQKELGSLREIGLLKHDYADILPHIFVIRVKNGKRDQLMKHLNQNNIQTGINYLPNHLLSFYQKEDLSLPTTESVYREILSLPLHPDLTEEMQERVIDQVKVFMSTSNN